MILLWLATFFRFLLSLLIPDPRRRRIDIHAACPACGHPSATLKTILRGQKRFVEHHCEVCDARWPEDVVNPGVVIRAAGEQ